MVIKDPVGFIFNKFKEHFKQWLNNLPNDLDYSLYNIFHDDDLNFKFFIDGSMGEYFDDGLHV